MNPMNKIFFAILFIILIPVISIGQTVLINSEKNIRGDKNGFFYIDKSKKLDITTISSLNKWKSSQELADKYIITKDPLWFKVDIINPTKGNIYCRIDNPRLDSIDIFIKK